MSAITEASGRLSSSRGRIRGMKHLAAFVALCAACALLFLLAPAVDLAVSRLFHDPAQGFSLAAWPPLRFVEATVPWITRLVILLAIVATAWLALIGKPLWRFDRRMLAFIIAAIALGPGLIVNTLLKDHWGRARPSQVEAFGGTRQFTPAPLPAIQCERNCAFVSGHAALGFSLVSFAFLAAPGWQRRTAVAAAIGFGGLVGLGRIAAGGHFLSDVIYAGLIVFATSWLLHHRLVVRDDLASPAALRLYSALRRYAVTMSTQAVRLYRLPCGRFGLWTAGIFLLEAAIIGWIDRPLAYYFHTSGAFWRPAFDILGRLGDSLPYLVLCAVAYAGLRWGGALPRLRRWAEPMAVAAKVPALLFAAVAASGLAVDLLKVIAGRTRPKLLFATGTYDFSWIGLQADYWSFPSGHASTVVALMTALWCLWPRHVLFYITIAALVAGSRIVTGAHFASDVIMGAFLAVVVTRLIAAHLAPIGSLRS